MIFQIIFEFLQIFTDYALAFPKAFDDFDGPARFHLILHTPAMDARRPRQRSFPIADFAPHNFSSFDGLPHFSLENCIRCIDYHATLTFHAV